MAVHESDRPTEVPGSGSRLLEIGEHECWELLATAPIGRLAVPAGDEAPSVFPVSFVLDDWVIVFRTGTGEKLFASVRGPVTFQADSYDHLHRIGWSVLVKGVAYEASEAEVGHLDLEPWVHTARDHWMRLVPLEVTGRRIVPGGADTDGRGYL
jgi:nitroimidazol reductase NimA-like FMN-containing flavoprotein (pyridoxamine 5'-phosphate oxidase superfamily)